MPTIDLSKMYVIYVNHPVNGSRLVTFDGSDQYHTSSKAAAFVHKLAMEETFGAIGAKYKVYQLVEVVE